MTSTRQRLDTVMAYERGLWGEATTLAHRAGIHPDRLPAAYADALRWSREVTHTAAL